MLHLRGRVSEPQTGFLGHPVFIVRACWCRPDCRLRWWRQISQMLWGALLGHHGSCSASHASSCLGCPLHLDVCSVERKVATRHWMDHESGVTRSAAGLTSEQIGNVVGAQDEANEGNPTAPTQEEAA